MPDVNAEVLEEIKKVGATSKENINELRSNYEALKKELKTAESNTDILVKNKIDKLVDDISTRQAEIDKSFAESKAAEEAAAKRMDELDILMQKHSDGDFKNDPKAEKELKQFALSTMKDGIKGSGLDTRIEELRASLPEYKKAFNALLRVKGDERQLSPEMGKALSIGSESDGGLTVTPFMSNRIVERIYEVSPMRQLATSQNISTDSLKGSADYFDTTDTNWAGETTSTANSDTPKMGEFQIFVNELESRPVATQQLLEDSAINIESWLGQKVGNKMARVEASAFMTGNGIGKPRGILTYDNGTDWGKIEQINSGAAATITADFFTNLKYGLKEGYLNRGTWLMNRTTVAAAMKLKDGAGAYIWKPSMIANDPSSNILGAPVRMATDMPEVAANALAVVYGDIAEAYMIVDRLGITLIRDPYTKKPFVEFYFRKRVGGDVVNFEALKIGKIAV